MSKINPNKPKSTTNIDNWRKPEEKWNEIVKKHREWLEKSTKNAKTAETAVNTGNYREKSNRMTNFWQNDPSQEPSKAPVSTPDPNRAFKKKNEFKRLDSLIDLMEED